MVLGGSHGADGVKHVVTACGAVMAKAVMAAAGGVSGSWRKHLWLRRRRKVAVFSNGRHHKQTRNSLKRLVTSGSLLYVAGKASGLRHCENKCNNAVALRPLIL